MKTQQVVLTVAEATKLLRIGRTKVYLLINDGTLKAFKLGSDWRISRSSLEKMTGPIPDDFFKAREKRLRSR
jgi:excisionase family DNA binding protein